MRQKRKIIFVENKDFSENHAKEKDQIAQPPLSFLWGVHMPDWHLCAGHKSMLAQISFSSFLWDLWCDVVSDWAMIWEGRHWGGEYLSSSPICPATRRLDSFLFFVFRSSWGKPFFPDLFPWFPLLLFPARGWFLGCYKAVSGFPAYCDPHSKEHILHCDSVCVHTHTYIHAHNWN